MVDDHILPDEYDNDDGLFQRRPRSLVVVSKEGKKLLLPIIPHHWSKHTWKDTKWNYSLASSCMTSIHIYQNVKKELNFIMSEVMRHCCCWVSTGVVGRGEIRTFRVLKSAMWYSYYYKHYLLMKCSFPYGKKIKSESKHYARLNVLVFLSSHPKSLSFLFQSAPPHMMY